MRAVLIFFLAMLPLSAAAQSVSQVTEGQSFTSFITDAPLASTPTNPTADLLPIIQGGLTKHIPIGSILTGGGISVNVITVSGGLTVGGSQSVSGGATIAGALTVGATTQINGALTAMAITRVPMGPGQLITWTEPITGTVAATITSAAGMGTDPVNLTFGVGSLTFSAKNRDAMLTIAGSLSVPPSPPPPPPLSGWRIYTNALTGNLEARNAAGAIITLANVNALK